MLLTFRKYRYRLYFVMYTDDEYYDGAKRNEPNWTESSRVKAASPPYSSQQHRRILCILVKDEYRCCAIQRANEPEMGGSLFSSCSLENFSFIIMKKIPGYSTKYFILNFKIFQTKTKKFNYFFLLFASFIHFLIDFLNFVHFFRITFEIFAL